MPIDKPSQDLIQSQPIKQVETTRPRVQEEPSFFETAGSYLRTENPLFNFLEDTADKFFTDDTFDPNFRAAEQPLYKKLNLTEAERKDIDKARNFDQFNNIVDRVLRRREDQQTIARSSLGATLGAGVITAVTDPINIVLANPALKAASLAAKAVPAALKAAAPQAVKTATKVSTAALMTTAATEGSLLATQAGRTKEEAMLNTAASAIVGGLIAGTGSAAVSAAKATKSRFNAMSKKETSLIDRLAEQTHSNIQKDVSQGPNSLAEAGVQAENAFSKVSAEDLKLDNSNIVFKGYLKATKKISPYTRIMTSNNDDVRSVGFELMSRTLKTTAEEKGPVKTISVEDAVNLAIDEDLTKVIKDQKSSYRAYKKRASAAKEKILSPEEFNIESTKANRRFEEHVIPEIAANSKHNKKLINKYTERLKAAKVYDEKVPSDEGMSYAMRMFNDEKIAAQGLRFKKVIKAGTQAQAKVDGVELSDEAAEAISEHLLAKTLDGNSATNIADMKIDLRGPLKGRTLRIDDTFSFVDDELGRIDFEEFLENDSGVLMERFFRVVVPELELRSKFGTADFGDLVPTMRTNIEKKKLALETDAERLKLEKQFQSELVDLRSTWDIIRGTYSQKFGSSDDLVLRAITATKNFTYLRSMGSVVKSALPDAASIMKMGPTKVFGKTLPKMISTLKAGKHSLDKELANQYGTAAEDVLASRVSSLYNLGDPYVKGTAPERFLQNATRNFSNLNLQSYWNNMMQEIVTLTHHNDIVNIARAVSKGKKIPTNVNKRLKFLGLDEADYKALAQQMDEFSSEVDGKVFMNFDSWSNKLLAKRIKAAVKREANILVPTKSAGDAPLFTRGPAGSMFFQFTGFNFASQNKILLASLQQADAAVASALISAISIGMLVYYLRTPEKYLSDDPSEWVREGLDRSGILALPFMMLNSKRAFEDPRSDAALKSLVGPSAEYVETIRRAIKAAKNGDITQSEVHAIRRLLPYQNLLYIKDILDKLEEGVNDMFNIKKSRRKKRRLQR